MLELRPVCEHCNNMLPPDSLEAMTSVASACAQPIFVSHDMNLAANADRSPFQWNAGTWLGAQLGGTGWLLGGALYMLLSAPEVSAIWLTGFLILNAIGWAFWRLI